MSYILGLNSVYHENSACLVSDGKIIAYAEEERFNRIKHSKISCPENTHLLPTQSIDYCLQAAGISGKDISQVGFSFVPDLRLRNINVDNYPITGTGYGTEAGERLLQKMLADTPGRIQQYLNNSELEFEWLDHHLCHAVSAFAVSPYREAKIMVLDGIAEFDTIYLGYARDKAITSIKRITYPNSLGFLWEKISRFLGYSKYDAGKIMGLAGYGNADIHYDNFRKFIDYGNGEFIIDNSILKIRSDDFTDLEKTFGIEQRTASTPVVLVQADIAAGLQRVTEEVILDLANYLYKQDNSETKNICLSGGVALNCLANAKLAEKGPFENIFIPPHCNDAGTSIGAALYLAGRESSDTGVHNSNKLFSPFWQTGPSDDDILQALGTTSFKHERVPDINRRTATLLAAGEILAYSHGAAEIGPRALGNRSILAAPDTFMIKEVINFKFKRREFFRPLAPVVLREHLTDYFEMPFDFSPALYYMLMALKVRADKLSALPGVTHIDGTARVQVVDEEINPNLYELLSIYYELTGIPILLNTSFNHQEPIVHTPLDAVRTFGKMPMLNYLIINDFLIRKE